MTATVDLVLFLVFPRAAYHGCVALLLAKMYSNSLMVLLNSRIRILGSRSERGTGEDSYNSLHINNSGPAAVHITPRSAAIGLGGGVHVHEQTWTRTDGETIVMHDTVSFQRTFVVSWLTALHSPPICRRRWRPWHRVLLRCRDFCSRSVIVANTSSIGLCPYTRFLTVCNVPSAVYVCIIGHWYVRSRWSLKMIGTSQNTLRSTVMYFTLLHSIFTV